MRRPIVTRSIQEEPGLVPRPLRWAFALFVLSIPFGILEAGFEESRYTVSKLAGYLMLGVAVFYPHISFRRFPRAGWFFLFYFAVLVVQGVVQPPMYHNSIQSRLFRLVQLIVLFWISYNLLRRPKMVTLTFRTLAAACTALAALAFLGVEVATPEGRTLSGHRLSAFGLGANGLAAELGVGAVAALGLVYGRAAKGFAPKLFTWIALPFIAVAIARTGSRGGLISLAVGVLVLLLRKGTAWSKLRNSVIVLAVLGVFLWANLSLELNQKRWERTLEGGSMAGREAIFPTAWQMFLEKPLVGWGPVTNTYTLGARLFKGRAIDFHNLYLWLLTEVGLVGGMPFMLGIAACVLAAWKARLGAQGSLPLALVIMILFTNLTLTNLMYKTLWIIFALCLASASPTGVESARSLILRGRRVGARRIVSASS